MRKIEATSKKRRRNRNIMIKSNVIGNGEKALEPINESDTLERLTDKSCNLNMKDDS